MSLAVCPCCWSGGARREGGVSPVCCVCVKQEKAPCCRACWVGCGWGAGGPTRSSGDASVMGAERRGWGVRDVFVLVNQGLWEELG